MEQGSEWSSTHSFEKVPLKQASYVAPGLRAHEKPAMRQQQRLVSAETGGDSPPSSPCGVRPARCGCVRGIFAVACVVVGGCVAALLMFFRAPYLLHPQPPLHTQGQLMRQLQDQLQQLQEQLQQRRSSEKLPLHDREEGCDVQAQKQEMLLQQLQQIEQHLRLMGNITADETHTSTTAQTTTTQTTVTTTTTLATTTNIAVPYLTSSRSCGICAQQRQQAKAHRIPAKRWAFVMMAHEMPKHNHDRLLAVLPIARALQRLSTYPLILLTNITRLADGTSVPEAFKGLNVQVMPLYEIELPKHPKLMFPHWKVAYWKLQIWNLTQFEKLIWLDSDSIIYRSIDWLFARPWMWAQRDDWFCKGNQKGVCSGIVLLYPNEEDFRGLLEYAETLDDLNDGDQQLISMYFANVRKKPIHLLSDVEAAFGQCIGRAPTPYLNPSKTPVRGVWSTPSFVHKSGGWENTNDNVYSNICFSHNLSRQYYVVGKRTLNMCQYHPLGAYWRNLFCDATAIVGVQLPEVDAFCSDDCWYLGDSAGLGDDEKPFPAYPAPPLNPAGSSVHGNPLCSKFSATISYHDYATKKVGYPVAEIPEEMVV